MLRGSDGCSNYDIRRHKTDKNIGYTVGQKYCNNRYRKLEDGDLNNLIQPQWLSGRQYQNAMKIRYGITKSTIVITTKITP